MSTNNKITLIQALNPDTLEPSSVCKKYSIVNDKIDKQSRADVVRGRAMTYQVDSSHQLVSHLSKVTNRKDVCILSGDFQGAPEGEAINIVTRKALGKMLKCGDYDDELAGVHLIDGKYYAARIKTSTNPSNWLLLDADNPPGMPDEWADMSIAQRLELWEPILPGISKCERIELRSSSSRVLSIFGSEQRKSHAWIRVSDADKIPTLKAYLKTHTVLKGVWFRTVKNGEVTNTAGSIFDLSVMDTGRLVFCSEPEIGEGMDDYIVDDAGIEIVNAGAGELNISGVYVPTKEEQHEAAKVTGVSSYTTNQNGELITIVVGELQWDTEIESRGKTKTLREWVEGYRDVGMTADDKIRCEAPFRDSQSEAAYIRLSRGIPFVYDIGNNTKYVLPEYVIDGGDDELLDMFEIVSNPATDNADSVLNSISSKLNAKPSVVAKRIGYKPSAVSAVISSSSWNSNKSKFFLVKPMLKVSSEKDFPKFVSELFDPMYNYAELEAMALERANELELGDAQITKFVSGILGAAVGKIMDLIKIHRQFDALELNVDPFIQTGTIVFKTSELAVLHLPHTPLEGGHIDPAIIADFKQHFPEFDLFISLLVAARFASDRKQAHMWMQAPSNWGKSFLLGCLAAHGLVVETSVSELDKIFSGNPVGKTITDFLRAWVLAVDEFKGVTREVKQLSDTLPFAPKGLATVRTPLYLKMFLSAEDVPSLASGDGVEDQFANRFTHVKTVGRLDSRPLFNKSKFEYKQSMVNYIAERVNHEVATYVAMGKGVAADAANLVVSEFYERHRIDRGFSRLSDSIESVADDLVQWLTDAYRKLAPFSGEAVYGQAASRMEREAYSYVIQDEDNQRDFYVANYDRAVELWLEECFDTSSRGTIKHKRNQIKNELLSRKQDSTRWGHDAKGAVIRNRINGKQLRYIPLIFSSDVDKSQT